MEMKELTMDELMMIDGAAVCGGVGVVVALGGAIEGEKVFIGNETAFGNRNDAYGKS